MIHGMLLNMIFTSSLGGTIYHSSDRFSGLHKYAFFVSFCFGFDVMILAVGSWDSFSILCYTVRAASVQSQEGPSNNTVTKEDRGGSEGCRMDEIQNKAWKVLARCCLYGQIRIGCQTHHPESHHSAHEWAVAGIIVIFAMRVYFCECCLRMYLISEGQEYVHRIWQYKVLSKRAIWLYRS